MADEPTNASASSGTSALASTPASAPSPSPSPEPTSSATPAADDFSQLGEPDDYSDSVELAPETPAPVEVVPPVVEPAKVAAPAAPVPEPPKVEPPKAVAPVAAEVPKGPAAAAPPPSDPQSLTEQLTQHRDALVEAIAAERFKLSPEEMNALEIDAVGSIPKLLARVYYEAVTASLNHIQNFVPQMQANFRQAEQANAEAEKVFYGAFPTLDKTKHHADVLQFAKLFRTANPSLSREDFMSMVGAAVMAKHGITAGQKPNGQVPGAVPKPAATPPFVPAQAGATVSMTPETPSPWAGLGQEFED